MELSILNLTKPINTLDRISEKISLKLNKINIYTIIDLLFYFPIGIINRKFCNTIKDLAIKEQCVIKLKVLKHLKTQKTKQILCEDINHNQIIITFFKIYLNYLDNYFPLNQEIVVIGTPEVYNGNIIFNHPERVLKPYSVNGEVNIDKIHCIYRQYHDLTSYKFKDYISQALKILNSCTIPEWLEEEYIINNDLPSFKAALNAIHNPMSQKDIALNSKNIIRLAMDEMVCYHILLLLSRRRQNLQNGIKFNPTNILNKKLLKQLPFSLTTDQINAITLIKSELCNEKKSVILLQGDVGSGKSIVCFISAVFALESGYQAAFMAPTEILANQHYQNLSLYETTLNINIALLKGKEKPKVKKTILENLITEKSMISPRIDILVGTHAILEDDIKFNKLGLIIIDEQHKFGVNQRLKLLNKAHNPKVILTTATPIPRTLALALYGDIKIIEIKNKPTSRKQIITTTLAKGRLAELISSLQEVLKKGEKIFWVCPLVEESEKTTLTSAVQRHTWLKENIINYNILLVHGKLKAQEKDNIINEFKNAILGTILVSTTVIEVGIDIPSSNIIIIEDAEKFGLAQLHQLRGRVGRSDKQGTCILLYNDDIHLMAKKRLNIIKNNDDGFIIAEKDLEIRGYGDLAGITQSGLDYFKVMKIDFHGKYLIPCINQAKSLISNLDNLKPNSQQNIDILINIFNKSTSLQYLPNG
ncbi:ATP-dependent DNA helicase RecG [Candidatus Hepatincolaceae symbiont of Richtersius coronifer]